MYKFLCVSVNARDPADTRLNRKWQVFWLYPYPTRLPGQSSSDLVCRSCKKGLTASGNVADSHCIPVLAPTRALLNACIFNENAAWIWTVKNQMRCKDIKNYWTNQKKQEKNLKHLHNPIQYPIFYISFYLTSPATLMRHFIVFAQYHLYIAAKTHDFTTEKLRKNEDISSKAN